MQTAPQACGRSTFPYRRPPPRHQRNPKLGTTAKGLGAERHHGHRADDDQANADPEVYPLIADETRGDALVYDVALLEEELPRRDGGADDRDDQQHHVVQFRACRKARYEEIVRHLPKRRMNLDEYRHE